ncbi:MAG: toll/interleukin-1 receptor domain-containing protein [Pseudomonadota bacterium]
MSTPTDEAPRPDIFLSYKREERREAGRVAQALEQVGWDVWWDPELRGGERFDDVIGNALARSRCVVVLWSRAAVESRYIRDEASFGLKERKLVPLCLDDCELPFRFQGLHTLDFSRWSGKADAPEFTLLRRDLEDRIGAPGSGGAHTQDPQVVDPPPPKRHLALIIAGASAALLAVVIAWVGIGGDTPTGECVLRLTVSVDGPRTSPRELEPRALEVTNDADRVRPLSLQRDPQTSARVATTSFDRRKLTTWRVVLRWHDGTQSQFPVRTGCESGEEVSDDGLARLRITTL